MKTVEVNGIGLRNEHLNYAQVQRVQKLDLQVTDTGI
jgi:hypothetical protein